CMTAQDLAEKGGDELSLGMVYNLLGNLYKQDRSYEKAVYFSTKYLELAKRTGNREGEATALNNIGNLLMEKGEYTLALQHYEDSLRIILDTGAPKQLLAQGYLSLGRAFKKLGEYRNADESISLGRNIFSELGNAMGAITGLWELAGNYGLQGEYGPAIKILEENLSRAEDPGLKQHFIDDLIRYSEKSHDLERAAKYRKMKGS
ncbi:MAG TPA: tetratricopeptide repeat protein, partial [Dissulfurispiraceae bacterium]